MKKAKRNITQKVQKMDFKVYLDHKKTYGSKHNFAPKYFGSKEIWGKIIESKKCFGAKTGTP